MILLFLPIIETSQEQVPQAWGIQGADMQSMNFSDHLKIKINEKQPKSKTY